MPKYFLHTVLWIIAGSLLNCSIDVAGIRQSDFNVSAKPTLHEWNRFESICEWVAEELFQRRDAIPETHSKHSNQHGIVKKHGFVVIALKIQKQDLPLHRTVPAPTQVVAANPGKEMAGFVTLFSPPPNA